MIPYIGDFAEDATIYHYFNTFDSNDPSASVTTTNLIDSDIFVYKDGSVTDLTTDGATVAIDFDSRTGLHKIEIDTSVHADYAIGSDYLVSVVGITVDGATLNVGLFTFSIENRFNAAADDLANGTDGLGALKTLIDAIQTDLDNGTDGLGALKGLIDTAQSDLDTITGTDGATLATAQALYAPAKAGDSMDVSSISGSAPAADAVEAVFTGAGDTADVDLSARSLSITNDAGVALAVSSSTQHAVTFTASGGSGKNALRAVTTSTVADAIYVNGTNSGIYTSGDSQGMYCYASGGTGLLLSNAGTGSEWGFRVVGGTKYEALATGVGVEFVGGATSGSAVSYTNTSGDLITGALVAANFAASSLDGKGDWARSVIAGAATGTPTTTSMDTDLTGYADSELVDRLITFNGGTADGQQAIITGYTSTSGVITFAALTTAPVSGDTFDIT
jgi:hypothetical protein